MCEKKMRFGPVKEVETTGVNKSVARRFKGEKEVENKGEGYVMMS